MMSPSKFWSGFFFPSMRWWNVICVFVCFLAIGWEIDVIRPTWNGWTNLPNRTALHPECHQFRSNSFYPLPCINSTQSLWNKRIIKFDLCLVNRLPFNDPTITQPLSTWHRRTWTEADQAIECVKEETIMFTKLMLFFRITWDGITKPKVKSESVTRFCIARGCARERAKLWYAIIKFTQRIKRNRSKIISDFHAKCTESMRYS